MHPAHWLSITIPLCPDIDAILTEVPCVISTDCGLNLSPDCHVFSGGLHPFSPEQLALIVQFFVLLSIQITILFTLVVHSDEMLTCQLLRARKVLINATQLKARVLTLSESVVFAQILSWTILLLQSDVALCDAVVFTIFAISPYPLLLSQPLAVSSL